MSEQFIQSINNCDFTMVDRLKVKQHFSNALHLKITFILYNLYTHVTDVMYNIKH